MIFSRAATACGSQASRLLVTLPKPQSQASVIISGFYTMPTLLLLAIINIIVRKVL
jgi:hypothetical protein